MWITYLTLSNKLGTNFSTPLIFNFLHMKGKSLWESCNSLGYLISTSRRYPLFSNLANLEISSGLTLVHLKPPVGSG